MFHNYLHLPFSLVFFFLRSLYRWRRALCYLCDTNLPRPFTCHRATWPRGLLAATLHQRPRDCPHRLPHLVHLIHTPKHRPIRRTRCLPPCHDAHHRKWCAIPPRSTRLRRPFCARAPCTSYRWLDCCANIRAYTPPSTIPTHIVTLSPQPGHRANPHHHPCRIGHLFRTHLQHDRLHPYKMGRPAWRCVWDNRNTIHRRPGRRDGHGGREPHEGLYVQGRDEPSHCRRNEGHTGHAVCPLREPSIGTIHRLNVGNEEKESASHDNQCIRLHSHMANGTAT